MMQIINHFPHAVGIMKMGGSIPDVEFTVMHEGRRTKVIAKSVREARMKGAEKLGADPEEVSAVMSSYDIHADMFSYHPEEEMADGGMMARGGQVSKYNVHFNYNPGNVSDDYLVNIVEGYTKNWRHNNDWDQRSFFVMDITKDDAESLVSDLSMEDVYNVEMDASRYADGGMMARGGRPLSAINRDRAYQSDEEWEKNYKRRSAPSNPRYNTED